MASLRYRTDLGSLIKSPAAEQDSKRRKAIPSPVRFKASAPDSLNYQTFTNESLTMMYEGELGNPVSQQNEHHRRHAGRRQYSQGPVGGALRRRRQHPQRKSSPTNDVFGVVRRLAFGYSMALLKNSFHLISVE